MPLCSLQLMETTTPPVFAKRLLLVHQSNSYTFDTKMSVEIRPLQNSDQSVVSKFLEQNTITNLYILDLLDRQGVNYWGLHRWTGAFLGTELLALNVDIACTENQPCKLSVPVGHPELCVHFGRRTANKGGVERIMAERVAADAFWEGLGQPIPKINHPQWVMHIDQNPLGDALNIRPGTKELLPQLIESTALMRLEDEGTDPRIGDYSLWQQTIEILVAQRRIWVGMEKGELGFVIEIGTRCKKGAQIGSTYVPRHLRGRGLSTRGMRAIVKRMLVDCDSVSLLVKEDNIPALRCYERVGFKYGEQYRLYSFV